MTESIQRAPITTTNFINEGAVYQLYPFLNNLGAPIIGEGDPQTGGDNDHGDNGGDYLYH
jgi:hypothetical protein